MSKMGVNTGGVKSEMPLPIMPCLELYFEGKGSSGAWNDHWEPLAGLLGMLLVSSAIWPHCARKRASLST